MSSKRRYYKKVDRCNKAKSPRDPPMAIIGNTCAPTPTYAFDNRLIQNVYLPYAQRMGMLPTTSITNNLGYGQYTSTSDEGSFQFPDFGTISFEMNCRALSTTGAVVLTFQDSSKFTSLPFDTRLGYDYQISLSPVEFIVYDTTTKSVVADQQFHDTDININQPFERVNLTNMQIVAGQHVNWYYIDQSIETLPPKYKTPFEP